MKELIKDLSKQKISNVYEKHEGQKFTHYVEVLSVDDDFIIITCAHLELIKDYLFSSKRVYVLLDKNIQSRDYLSMLNNNIWFIPTDMNLPTLILSDGTIYHLSLNLQQDDHSKYTGIRYFLIYLIQKYVQKQQDIDYDYFEPESIHIRKLSSVENAIDQSDYIISDTYTTKRLITTQLKKQSSDSYIKIDHTRINYMDIIIDKKLKCLVSNMNEIYLMDIDFDFDIDNFEYIKVIPEITYEDAYKKRVFNFNHQQVIINELEKQHFNVKVDLLRVNDTNYLEEQYNKIIKNIAPKAPCIKVVVNIDVVEMNINDFTNPTLLSIEKTQDLMKDEYSENIRLYQTQEGIVAINDRNVPELANNKKIKYIISK